MLGDNQATKMADAVCLPTRPTVQEHVESKYQASLRPGDKLLYKNKLQSLNGIDPYCLKFSNERHTLPEITYIDIVNYLVLSPNPVYTVQEMRSYKGLDAHNQFTSGWVRDVAVAHVNDVAVITARVLHSQSLNDTATKPWVIVEKSGNIHTANCDCKAGLGGTCTHVSATLFWVEAAIRHGEKKTVTQEKAYWLLPSGVKKVSYEPAHRIDFTSAKSRRKKLDSLIDSVSDHSDRPRATCSIAGPVSSCRREIPTPGVQEIADFMQGLDLIGANSSILTVTEPYNSKFVPKVAREEFPRPLTDLRKESLCVLEYDRLLAECSSIQIAISQKEADLIEKSTRSQSDSKLWFRYRAGRVTASRMKSVCHTDINMPAASLIKQICYPETAKFHTKATVWGCEHESAAREDYILDQNLTHDNFECVQSGLVIDPTYPFLGATPDGIVSCSCCGPGLLEIKCPFCVKDKEATKHPCLIETEDEVYSLDKKHPYYYQVQAQLFLCHKDYCDFVVWTEKGHHKLTILPDEDFWAVILPKTKEFFEKVLLMELVGKFYSRAPHVNSSLYSTPRPSTSDSQNTVGPARHSWCYCRRSDEESLIICGNENCPIQRFHLSCLKLSASPKKGKWYCPECRKKPKKKSEEMKKGGTKRKLVF